MRCIFTGGSFENEALENEDRSTNYKHPNLENEAPKPRKRSTLKLENEDPKTWNRSVLYKHEMVSC